VRSEAKGNVRRPEPVKQVEGVLDYQNLRSKFRVSLMNLEKVLGRNAAGSP
jgi:hypothetical protein